MIHYMLLVLLASSNYGASEAHQDSLFLYNAYKESARTLENMKPGKVYSVDNKLAQATTAAVLRLSEFNNQPYETEQEYNKEGVGVAYSYPEPSANPVAFKVLDRQTRFIVDHNGKTKTPYVIMNYYAKGRILVKTEKLNPVTLEPIKTDDAVYVASSE